jgi:hypothetical protein
MTILVVTLATVECAQCSLPFGVTEHLMRERRNDHATFYCPRGHGNYYPHESDEEQLRRRLKFEREKTARLTANLDQTTASLSATKGVVTKQRQKLARVKAGVCPCCNRSFQNLGRHMESKHPGYRP